MLEWLSLMDTTKFKSTSWQSTIADGFTATGVKRLTQALISHILDNSEYGFNSAEYKNFCQKRNIKHKRPLVVIGYDTRFMSDAFANICANMLAEKNIAVKFSAESIPTAAVAYSVIKYTAIGGITITGGEGPYYMNGFKWTAFWGGPALTEIVDDIERRISHAALSLPTENFNNTFEHSLIEVVSFKKDYLKYLSSFVDIKAIKKSKLKIAFDSLHGATGGFIKSFIESCGVKVVAIRQMRDVMFEKKAPITGPKSLSVLSKLTVQNKLDLGIACDADGDGFGVVDSDGKWISPNEIIALILEHIIRNRKVKGTKVCRNVVTSHFIDAVCKNYGLTVRETPIGFNHIGNLMRTGQYLLGAEESGGLSIANHVPDKDGILACMLVMEMLSYYKKPLKTILSDFHKKYGDFISTKISIPSKGLKIEHIMRRLDLKPPLNLAGFPVWRIDQTDGFKFILKDLSWLAIRPSTTDDIVRLYAEATSKPKLEKLLKESERILKGDF